jgi:putative endonuclease
VKPFMMVKGNSQGFKVSTKASIGQRGETLATEYLRSKGYAILVRNWKCPQGELDIVAKIGSILVFVEVKTRRAENNEDAFASVVAAKRQRLLAAVHQYLQAHNLEENDWRVDVIAVALSQNASPLIEQVEDALDW